MVKYVFQRICCGALVHKVKERWYSYKWDSTSVSLVWMKHGRCLWARGNTRTERKLCPSPELAYDKRDFGNTNLNNMNSSLCSVCSIWRGGEQSQTVGSETNWAQTQLCARTSEPWRHLEKKKTRKTETCLENKIKESQSVFLAILRWANVKLDTSSWQVVPLWLLLFLHSVCWSVTLKGK